MGDQSKTLEVSYAAAHSLRRYADLASMELGELAGDEEAESTTTVLRVGPGRGLREPLEQDVDFFGRESAARILNLEPDTEQLPVSPAVAVCERAGTGCPRRNVPEAARGVKEEWRLEGDTDG